MFPEPVDLGIAPRPIDAVSSVTHGTQSYLEGEGGERGSTWYHGGGAAKDKAVQGITIYPPTRGLQTQGDPFEPVKIGILIDMDLNQLLADWIDPTILAIEDALNEGVWARSPVQLVIADARGLPRENYRKVIDGYRWLVEQGCVVVLGPMISDNSPGAAGHGQRARRGLHRLDRRAQVRVGVLLHRGQRRHPHRGRDVRPVAARPRGSSRSACSGRPGRRARTTPTTSATPPLGLGMTITREVKLEPNPVGLQDDLDTHARARHRGHLLRRATATPRSTSPRRSRRSTGIRPASWAPRSCSIRTATPGPRGSRAGTASTSWARTAPTPTTTPWSTASRSASAAATRNVVVALAYDTARVAIHGIANAAIPHPRWVKEGMERIRWMPATNGGPGHLHPVRSVGPQGLQGRLPHDPRAARRRAALRRLPPPRVAEQCRVGRERQGLHPRAHRHHRAQPRPVHAPHDGQLVPGGARGAQPAVLRRVGDRRLDRSVARGREHVGARRLGRPGRQLQPRAVATTRCRIRRWPSGGPWPPSCAAAGVDRIVVPEPWTDPIDALVAARRARRGVRPRAVPVRGRVGRATCSTRWHEARAGGRRRWALTCVGAFNVAMVNDSECLAIWALPDWTTWADYERAWDTGGAMRPWAEWLAAVGHDDGALPAGRRAAGAAAPRAPARGRRPPPLDRALIRPAPHPLLRSAP